MEEAQITTEYMATRNPKELPPHELRLCKKCYCHVT